MLDFFEKGFLATVGAFSLTREKTQEMVDELVKRGEINREEGKQLVERMVNRGEEEQNHLRKLVHQEVHKVLNELNLATKKDLEDLQGKLDAILNKVGEV